MEVPNSPEVFSHGCIRYTIKLSEDKLVIEALANSTKRFWTGSWASFPLATGLDISPQKFFQILRNPPSGVTITFPKAEQEDFTIICTIPVIGCDDSVINLKLNEKDQGDIFRIEQQLLDMREEIAAMKLQMEQSKPCVFVEFN